MEWPPQSLYKKKCKGNICGVLYLVMVGGIVANKGNEKFPERKEESLGVLETKRAVKFKKKVANDAKCC